MRAAVSTCVRCSRRCGLTVALALSTCAVAAATPTARPEPLTAVVVLEIQGLHFDWLSASATRRVTMLALRERGVPVFDHVRLDAVGGPDPIARRVLTDAGVGRLAVLRLSRLGHKLLVSLELREFPSDKLIWDEADPAVSGDELDTVLPQLVSAAIEQSSRGPRQTPISRDRLSRRYRGTVLATAGYPFGIGVGLWMEGERWSAAGLAQSSPDYSFFVGVESNFFFTPGSVAPYFYTAAGAGSIRGEGDGLALRTGLGIEIGRHVRCRAKAHAGLALLLRGDAVQAAPEIGVQLIF